MSERKISLGGTGETVLGNVKRLRGGMQYKELAERLATIGRPIPTLGLRRIEAGERRVDADDLVALAVVFGVSPLTLLLPPDGSKFTSSPLTGVADREVSHNTQWLWALGREPLELPGSGISAKAKRDIALFQHRAIPDVDARSAAVAKFRRAEETEDTGDQQLVEEGADLARAQGLFTSNGDD